MATTSETFTFPASFAQQRLWFLDQLEPGSPAYNIPHGMRLVGPLDAEALQRSLAEVVRRHETLRTTFAAEEGQALQIVHQELDVPLSLRDLGTLPAVEREAEVRRLAVAEARRAFDLATGPLIRASLLRLSDEEHVLLLTIHHVICDGWSVGVLLKELSVLYEAFSSGKPSPLPEPPLQYADYAVWQREWLQGEALEEQISYWRGKLAGDLPPLELPADHPRISTDTPGAGSETLEIPEALAADLRALGQSEGATLFMTLLAAFQLLLSRHAGTEDVAVGTPVAGRNREEIEPLIGLFVNTLVLRTDLARNPTFRELLGRVRETCLGAYAHQDAPFEKLVEALHPDRNASRTPLFNVMFNLVNVVERPAAMAGLQVRPVSVSLWEPHYPLTLYVTEKGRGLQISAVYQRSLFSAERIACLLEQYRCLLEQVADAPRRPVASYSLMTPGTRALLPDPEAELPEPEQEPVARTILGWADRVPDAPAIRRAGRTWTYRELADGVIRLARLLVAQGLDRHQVVAVTGERSFGLIAGMLAAPLSGGVLLTLDPRLPVERRRLMLEQAGATALLAVGPPDPGDEGLRDAVSGCIAQVDPETGEAELLRKGAGGAGDALPDVSPEDLAYLFFTSGTTGVPKGVLGCHRGLSHFLKWQRETFAVGPGDRSGQLTALSFDVVLRDVFLALTSGATLCLPDNADDLAPERVLPWMAREGITLTHTVPALAQSWLGGAPAGVSLRALRCLFFAGEPLPDTLVRRWRERFPGPGQVVNLYGPTETTLAKCFYVVPDEPTPGVQPVGRPLPQTQALVLGEGNRLCGVGEAGEIVIRTPFRTLGYINGADEDRARFTRNPFREDEGDLLYRTGDRGRYRPDGTLEILGRLDDQVKIRGVRVEPGEVAAALLRHPAVEAAAVVARKDGAGDTSLAAYVVAPGGVAAADLRAYLAAQLPPAMVPAHYVLMESLPLTANGKVDRKALPEPNPGADGLGEEHVAPRTPLEEELAAIWEQVLHAERVGVHDNFFDLGGHSLLATQVLSRITATLGVEIPLRTFFETPTIAELAEHVAREKQRGEADAIPIPQAVEGDDPCASRAAEAAPGDPDMTPEERHRILVEWNRTDAEYPRDRCLHQLFEEQVERTPDAVAVVFTGGEWTYAELNRRANRLAHALRRRGVGPEDRVAVHAERSPDAIAALLAILKAGGAYVPLDPAYPEERLAFMLEDSGARVLLTQEHLRQRLSSPDVDAIALDGRTCPGRTQGLPLQPGPAIAGESPENPESVVRPDNLAYVIYTSGSTGQPKGVLIEHRGWCSLAHDVARRFEVGPGSRVLQFGSPSFDVSMGDIAVALTSGGALVVGARDTLLPGPALIRFLRDQEVTHLAIAPSALALVPPVGLPALRVVIPVGESLSAELVTRWAAGRRVVNGYGPTETTIYATFAECAPDGSKPLIGRPIANTRVYVLDEHRRPVPVGVTGELYIGGVGVARGYLNRPELTAERFVRVQGSGFRVQAPDAASHTPGYGRETGPNVERAETAGVQPGPRTLNPGPLTANTGGAEGERLYRTGDLVRWLPDGNLEFLGRIDHQVKLRGFRIELGEIESVLRQHPAVHECVVIAREDTPGDKRLVAYVIPHSHTPTLPHAELREFLAAKLPEYMVPSAFVFLDTLPLTPNGKLDRSALPASAGERPETSPYEAPRTPTETLVAQAFAEVLGVPLVGIHDSFFEMGGHSLLATRVVSRLSSALGYEVPLRWLFEHATVAGLAQTVDCTPRPEVAATDRPHVARGTAGRCPLSFSQQRLWFLDQLDPGSATYNIPVGVRLEGVLNVTALEGSLQEIVRRHAVLRTTFESVSGSPVQVVHPSEQCPLPLVDLRALSPSEREQEVRRLAEGEAGEPFDVARGPLIRWRLVALDDQEHVLLITVHHIVSDGWSMSVFFGELGTLYEALSCGKPSPLPELPLQYADFAIEQQERLQGALLEEQTGYWRRRLEGAPGALHLPTDHPRPPVQTFRGAGESFALPSDLTKSLKALANREGATLFMVLHAAWNVLLSRYSGQEDILVGTPIANRTQVETEGLIGFFANTLVLRTDLSGDPTFRDLLAQVRETALGAYAHQDLPFEKLVAEVHPERDLSRSPLFQVMFAFQNAPAPSRKLGELTLRYLPSPGATAKFDWSLVAYEKAGEIHGGMAYNTDLFEAATITRVLGHLRTLLEGMAADPDARLSALPILTAEERERMLVEWNRTDADYPHDRCVHHLFEEQAERAPDAVAVAFSGGEWTYAELNRRANQLAHAIRRRGVEPEARVAVHADRSPDAIAALLAILKAGGAYVPLDPGYPEERLAFMLQDSGARVLLTQEHLRHKLSSPDVRTIALDSDWPEIAGESAENPDSVIGPGHLAYVIYTSGSTGRPKGVLIEHRGWCSVGCDLARRFEVGPGSRVLQFGSPNFDVSMADIAMTLCSGGTLVVGTRDTLLPGPALLRLLRDQGVTHLPIAPSALAMLPPADLPALRVVIPGGEALSAELVTRWGHGRRVFNAYGPTETTIYATVAECVPDGSRPPIGRPITNTRCYILDRHRQPVPIGVPGELYIGGVGVARGYLNRPDLTAERFVEGYLKCGMRNAECGMRGARLYRTGDLVRWLPDGNLEYLGRIDHQVKLRGFRIELGEIESVLARHPDVQECVVLAREDNPGDKRLVAYVVPEDQRPKTRDQRPETADGGSPDTRYAAGSTQPADLRAFLAAKLPEYMVPSAFVFLEALPLTPNGKLDRKALPAPETGAMEQANVRVAPRDALEAQVARVFEQVLGVEGIGVTEGFFDLGGHSLLASRLLAQVRRVFGKDLPLTALFQAPTVERFAAILREEGYVPAGSCLAPIQTGGSLPPFFCVHGALGHVVVFRDLARRLGADQSFYALQPRGLDGRESPHASVEEMAEHYLREIASVQPEGPYFLGGYSFGGTVAFEMARRLAEQGQEVALLAVLDAGDPRYPTPSPHRAGFAFDVPGREDAEPVASADSVRSPWNKRGLTLGERLRGSLERYEAAAKDAVKGVVLASCLKTGRRLPRFVQSYRIREVCLDAGRRYTPRTYPGEAVLFCAETHTPDPEASWQGLTEGGLRVHRVPGNHWQMLEEPHVRVLADRLRDCLDAARGGEG